MEITVIGWYGTETIGDRAILAGLLRIFSLSFAQFNISLGSLYPFYTERTINEDIEFYKLTSSNQNLRIRIFNSLNPHELKHNVLKSDILCVGGGPLMDLHEMHMLHYAFSLAKRYSKKTVLLGCGWGPLKDPKIVKIASDLVKMSSVTIFRDNKSAEEYKKASNDTLENVFSLIDPAFFACDFYLNNVKNARANDHISINFRDISLEGTHYSNKSIPEDIFTDVIRSISDQSDLPIHLVPMHNFYIGGDDRLILKRLERRVNKENVVVIQHPLSLKETMDSYYHAAYCVGMRFHSIVLQTFLNGNNFIVDYTDPISGKIIGMMHEMEMIDFYKRRYYSIHSDAETPTFDLSRCERFMVSSVAIQEALQNYVKLVTSSIGA